MGRYIDQILQPDEKVLYSTNAHWIFFWPAIAGWMLAAVLLVLSGMVPAGPSALACLSLAAISAIFALYKTVTAWFHRWTTETDVTNLRVVHKTGFITRQTFEMSLDKIESVDVDQSVLGRLFDYGDVTIHGTGTTLEPLRDVDRPIAFRNFDCPLGARQLWSAASRRFAQSLVAALTLWLFGVLLALLVAAATLIALGLSAALVELLDAAGASGASRTARSASAKVLLLALAAALIILIAIALLELVGPTRSTWLAEVLLLLALAAATLVEIIVVPLLELIGAAVTTEAVLGVFIAVVAVEVL
jgi:uncharacterized membrane protein YdbT with pleckstrin-like domain